MWKALLGIALEDLSEVAPLLAVGAVQDAGSPIGDLRAEAWHVRFMAETQSFLLLGIQTF